MNIHPLIHLFRNRILPSHPFQLLLQTVIKWQRDQCGEMGAALAYYALFSLFPILLIVLSVVGSVLGTETTAYQQLLRIAEQMLPVDAFAVVKNTLLDLNRSSLGAGLVGSGLLLLTASRIFDALNQSVEKIWRTSGKKTQKKKVYHLALDFILGKILAFSLVLGTAFLLFLSLLSNIVIRVILEVVKQFEQAVNWFNIDQILLVQGLQSGITFFLLTAVVMGLYKVLPSTRVTWGDIWLGSVITVGLFLLLQRLVGSGVVSIGEQFRAYGVLGGVMVLMLWIYLTFQIFFLGCEFTYIYAHRLGSRKNEAEGELKV